MPEDVDIMVWPDRQIRRGRIEPTASLQKAKKDILGALRKGESPDDYGIAIAPVNRNPALNSVGIQAHDLVILFLRDDMAPPAFVLTDDTDRVG
jgi:hypothetical protein